MNVSTEETPLRSKPFVSRKTTSSPAVATTKIGSYTVVWTNGIINLCFLALYFIFQINACVLMSRNAYGSIITGVVIFFLALAMEFLLLIQPPHLMKWVPFWNNSFGRGFVLFLVSVVTMDGVLMLGLISLLTSIIVVFAFVFTGNYDVSPPVWNYYDIFPYARAIHSPNVIPAHMHHEEGYVFRLGEDVA